MVMIFKEIWVFPMYNYNEKDHLVNGAMDWEAIVQLSTELL